ncbi:MAG TPA: phage tail tube protein, partial [Burkholderiaceae bacterium]|nr:phage tail tube protein [Burkholderiaceae bacterium]
LGGGAGTATKVSGWTELGQVLGVTANGGDPKTITVSPLNRRTDILLPVGFNPSSLQFELGFDPALADQVALATASRSLDKRAFKFTLPGSAYAYCYGTVSMAPIPTFDTGSVMRRTVNISIDGLFTFFTS